MCFLCTVVSNSLRGSATHEQLAGTYPRPKCNMFTDPRRKPHDQSRRSGGHQHGVLRAGPAKTLHPLTAYQGEDPNTLHLYTPPSGALSQYFLCNASTFGSSVAWQVSGCRLCISRHVPPTKTAGHAVPKRKVRSFFASSKERKDRKQPESGIKHVSDRYQTLRHAVQQRKIRSFLHQAESAKTENKSA